MNGPNGQTADGDHSPPPLLPPTQVMVSVPQSLMPTLKIALRLANDNLRQDGQPMMGMSDLMLMATTMICNSLLQEAAMRQESE